ncbi:hypothetical protein, partial [Mycobacterium kansasii]|uniref:hypothetical protein n=1 Tax=Mycobacterium kansasii TaxID=1768 RepID=UPI00159BCEC7
MPGALAATPLLSPIAVAKVKSFSAPKVSTFAVLPLPMTVATLAVLPIPVELTSILLLSPKALARVATLPPPPPAEALTWLLPSPIAVAMVARLAPM